MSERLVEPAFLFESEPSALFRTQPFGADRDGVGILVRQKRV